MPLSTLPSTTSSIRQGNNCTFSTPGDVASLYSYVCGTNDPEEYFCSVVQRVVREIKGQ